MTFTGLELGNSGLYFGFSVAEKGFWGSELGSSVGELIKSEVERRRARAVVINRGAAAMHMLWLGSW